MPRLANSSPQRLFRLRSSEAAWRSRSVNPFQLSEERKRPDLQAPVLHALVLLGGDRVGG
eukprot:15090781-Alexandrium_andersonii.AAC.1